MYTIMFLLRDAKIKLNNSFIYFSLSKFIIL